MSESKWPKVKEMTIELGIYLLVKATLDENVVTVASLVGKDDPGYAAARLEAHKKIFDSLVADGYLNCIPIEGVDGFMARFAKKPDDFEEMMKIGWNSMGAMDEEGEENKDDKAGV